MPDLYGKLNKEVRIYNYDGVETDTAKVTVDNKTQDISVDVKKVPNELTLTTINGDTYTYDGSEPASFDIRTQVTDKVEEGNNLPVTSDAVKGYVDSKAGALEYVGGEGNFTNINGGITVKGRLNVDDGIYSPVTSEDPNFVPNNKSVDDKITASEQKLIDERIGAFTRTADKLFTDVTGGMTIKGHLNVDGGITSASAPTDDTDVTNKGYVDDLCGTKLDKTGGTITGDLVVEQNLTIKGTTTTVDTKNLEVKDNLITVAKDNVAPLIAPAGLRVPKYDGTNDGALVFDSNGTAYVGDVVLDGDGNIDAEASTGLQPIATRTGLVNGRLVQWDGANTTLVDSGIQPWEIVKKYTNDYMPSTGQEGVYGYDGTEQTFYEFGIGFSQYGNIPKYVDDGNGLPSIPVVNMVKDETVEGYAINKAYTDANYVAKKTTTDGIRLYAYDSNGDTSEMASATATPYTIARRDVAGHVRTADPKDATDAVNKEYAEANFVSKVTAKNIAYTTNNDGVANTTHISFNPTAYDLVTFDGKACLRTSNPTGDDGRQCVNKQYADAHYVKSVAGTTNAPAVYIRGQDGTDKTASLDSLTASAYSVAQRDVNGNIKVGTASANGDAVNKKYAEDNFVTKVTTGNRNQAYTVDTNNQQVMMGIDEGATAWALARRYTGGRLQVGTPSDDADATTKAYVDAYQTITILGADE